MTSRLRSIEEIPEPYNTIFNAYPSFNRIQSTVFDDLLHTTSSIVVTAPTGSGKTALFELALVKLLIDEGEQRSFKAVYVAPVKALCNERYEDWNSRFSTLGISCIEVTGDSLDDPDLSAYQIILTTPEKWDTITRRWRDKNSLVPNVKLLMIDEIHLLRDEKRGPVLESIVCRMKTMMRLNKNEGSVRFIGVSATIYNIEDLAMWLGSREEPAISHRFGNESRPVTLNRIVKGFPQGRGQNAFLYDITLSYKIKPLLMTHSEGKPVLIFCSTRRGVTQTCKVLSENLSFQFSEDHKKEIMAVCNQITEAKLRDHLFLGVGYHHAGLVATDRKLVQDLFMQGLLPVLVATSTLAMGVNLPAHLVIIKSTHQFISGRVEEYADSTVLQMVGRAGRPQFDTSATAIILTKPEMVNHYEKLLDCKEVLESSLHLHLAEFLNAEIVLLTIGDLSIAMEWLKCTFLYQRAVKNPKYYNVGFAGDSVNKIEQALQTMVLREINALKKAELVEMDKNGMDISPTANGKLMSYYYVSFLTFKLFSDIKPTATVNDLLCLLSDSHEMADVQLRVNERRTLNELNICKTKECVRFPLDGKISNRSMKVNCLVQASLGCLAITEPSLFQEALRAVSVLERIGKCMIEYLRRKNWYVAYVSALTLTKCLHARLWENSFYVSRQLERIGPALSSILVSCGKTSFEILDTSSPQELEKMLNKGPPFGSILLDKVSHLPRYNIDVGVDRQEITKNVLLSISISIENLVLVSRTNTAGPYHSVTVIVGDTNNRLLHSRKVPDTTLILTPLIFDVKLHFPLPQRVIISVISNQWVGLDVTKSVTVSPFVEALVSCTSHLAYKTVVTKAKVTKKVTKKKNPVDNKPKNESSKNNAELDLTLEEMNENVAADNRRVIPQSFKDFKSPSPLSQSSYLKAVEESHDITFDLLPSSLEALLDIEDPDAAGITCKSINYISDNSVYPKKKTYAETVAGYKDCKAQNQSIAQDTVNSYSAEKISNTAYNAENSYGYNVDDINNIDFNVDNEAENFAGSAYVENFNNPVQEAINRFNLPMDISFATSEAPTPKRSIVKPGILKQVNRGSVTQENTERTLYNASKDSRNVFGSRPSQNGLETFLEPECTINEIQNWNSELPGIARQRESYSNNFLTPATLEESSGYNRNSNGLQLNGQHKETDCFSLAPAIANQRECYNNNLLTPATVEPSSGYYRSFNGHKEADLQNSLPTDANFKQFGSYNNNFLTPATVEPSSGYYRNLNGLSSHQSSAPADTNLNQHGSYNNNFVTPSAVELSTGLNRNSTGRLRKDCLAPPVSSKRPAEDVSVIQPYLNYLASRSPRRNILEGYQNIQGYQFNMAASAKRVSFGANSRPQPRAPELNSNRAHQTLHSLNERKGNASSIYPKLSNIAENHHGLVNAPNSTDPLQGGNWQVAEILEPTESAAIPPQNLQYSRSFDIPVSNGRNLTKESSSSPSISYSPLPESDNDASPEFAFEGGRGVTPLGNNVQYPSSSAQTNVFGYDNAVRTNVAPVWQNSFEVAFQGNLPRGGFEATSRNDVTFDNNSFFGPNFNRTYPMEAPFQVNGRSFDAAESVTSSEVPTSSVNPYFNGNRTNTVEVPIQDDARFYSGLGTSRNFSAEGALQENVRFYEGVVTSRNSPDFNNSVCDKVVSIEEPVSIVNTSYFSGNRSNTIEDSNRYYDGTATSKNFSGRQNSVNATVTSNESPASNATSYFSGNMTDNVEPHFQEKKIFNNDVATSNNYPDCQNSVKTLNVLPTSNMDPYFNEHTARNQLESDLLSNRQFVDVKTASTNVTDRNKTVPAIVTPSKALASNVDPYFSANLTKTPFESAMLRKSQFGNFSATSSKESTSNKSSRVIRSTSNLFEAAPLNTTSIQETSSNTVHPKSPIGTKSSKEPASNVGLQSTNLFEVLPAPKNCSRPIENGTNPFEAAILRTNQFGELPVTSSNTLQRNSSIDATSSKRPDVKDSTEENRTNPFEVALLRNTEAQTTSKNAMGRNNSAVTSDETNRTLADSLTENTQFDTDAVLSRNNSLDSVNAKRPGPVAGANWYNSYWASSAESNNLLASSPHTSQSFGSETTSHYFGPADTVRRDQVAVQNGYPDPCAPEPIPLPTFEESITADNIVNDTKSYGKKIDIVQFGKQFAKPTEVIRFDRSDQFAENEISSPTAYKKNEYCSVVQCNSDVNQNQSVQFKNFPEPNKISSPYKKMDMTSYGKKTKAVQVGKTFSERPERSDQFASDKISIPNFCSKNELSSNGQPENNDTKKYYLNSYGQKTRIVQFGKNSPESTNQFTKDEISSSDYSKNNELCTDEQEKIAEPQYKKIAQRNKDSEVPCSLKDFLSVVRSSKPVARSFAFGSVDEK